jgi:hypothetical protein
MVALMNIMSPTYCAEKFTFHRKPKSEELPHIGTAQDIAWAAWNRAGAVDTKDIKYLIVTQIMNPQSRQLYIRALGTLTPPQSEFKLWPGQDFAIDSPGGLAILGMLKLGMKFSDKADISSGSPVGRWAGYFVLQHKEKLGGNRFISKVRLWKPDVTSLPYLLFYVDPTPVGDGSAAHAIPRALSAEEAEPVVIPSVQDGTSSRIVKRSADGKHVVREHVVYVSS